MAIQVIRMDATSFETLAEGHRTCAILKNDRLWRTGDELWMAEARKGDELTGRVIRVVVSFIQFGEIFGLKPAHVLLNFRPLQKPLERIGVENASAKQIEAALYQSRETLLDEKNPALAVL